MIGFYVHHHGRGHATRATAVAQRVRADVVGWGSGPPPDGWPGVWEELPADDAPAGTDPTASGRLHWVPPTAGVRDRAAALSAGIARHRPATVMVDVSVEATLLVRLHGVPVVVVGQPGTRDDRPHALAHDVAELLALPWPATVGEEPWTTRTATPTLHVGAVSRFDGRCAPPPARTRGAPAPAAATRATRVLVLLGAGGHAIPDGLLQELADARPDLDVEVLGTVASTGAARPNLHLRGWVDDPWPHLVAADVVLAHAGQNAVADVAAARRPAVLVPQQRPHDEQVRLAGVLSRHGLAEVVDQDVTAPLLAAALDRARACGGSGWSRWHDGRGATRLARLLDGVATGRAAA